MTISNEPTHTEQSIRPAQPPRKHRRWPWWLLGAFILAAVIGGIASNTDAGKTDLQGIPPATTTSATAPSATAPAPSSTTPVRHGTVSQEQALGQARDYLAYSAFSRAGLIDQLASPYGGQFSRADATWAVNQLTVNWNNQAVRAAKDYLAYSHFSRAGLIDQLSSPYGGQFTRPQAVYAADHVGL